MLADLYYSARALAQRPGFAAVVILTLALGIGANTAIFSVVNAVLLRPLPYDEPDRLLRVWSAFPEDDIEFGTTSPLDLTDWRAGNATFEALAGYPSLRLGGFVLTGGESPEELETTYVTEDFFEVFGLEAVVGQPLRAADHVEGDNRVVVLSHGAWTRRFGSDPAIVGTTLVLNGDPFIVKGVMPAEFQYPSAGVELWVPLSLIPESGIPRRRPVRFLNIVARLADGVSIEAARSEMDAITSELARQYPDSNANLTTATMRPLHDQMIGDVRPAMLTVFAAVGFVLLIGCTNVANLALARAEGRSREVAVRAALGAGRGRLLRHVLTESVVLACAGGIVGVGLAIAGVALLTAMAPDGIPRLSTISVDTAALLFTFGLALLTGVLFGMVPAFRVASTELQAALKEGGRGSDGGGGRFRASLVVAEVALVVVLTIGAGLLIRSYTSLLDVDPGFEPDNVLTLRVAARGDDGYVDFLHEAVERIGSLPGVESAAMVRPLPLAPDTFQGEGIGFDIPGRPVEADDGPGASLRFVGPRYFETMGIPLLAGRDFRAGDDRESPMVVIVSRETARRYWPDANPVGTSILINETISVPIVGMVGDVRQLSLAETPEPVIYVSHRQSSRVGMTFVVRTAADPASLIGAIQREIWALRPDQPINDIASMSAVIAGSVAQPRFAMTLLTVFAGLALSLAAVGIYGVISYSVGRRRRELGIRMALGADPRRVLALVVVGGVSTALIGVMVGLAGAVVATRVMAGLLFGVPPVDPFTFAAVALLLLAVALFASAVPALRASRIDPVVALRSD